MSQVILCRHGETQWNRDGRYQGQTDIPLNDRGFAQARELARTLKSAPIVAVYSSTLTRAYETARAIAVPHGLTVFQDHRFDEINQGLWEGLRREEIVEAHGELHERWLSRPLHLRLPNGESLDEVRSRVRSALEDIFRLHVDQTFCIVAHSVTMAVVKHELQGISLVDAFRGLPKNASAEWIEVREYRTAESGRTRH